MGGYITTLIRFSDGEILSKETWTNSFFHNVKTLKFIQEDKEFIKELLEEDSDSLVPSEYGVIFFDFLNKRIDSLQNYSHPQNIYPNSSFASGDGSAMRNFNELVQKDVSMIKGYSSYGENELYPIPDNCYDAKSILCAIYSKYLSSSDKQLSFDELYRKLYWMKVSPDTSYLRFIIDNKMDINHKPEPSNQDYKELFDFLKKNGFTFNEFEKNSWLNR